MGYINDRDGPEHCASNHAKFQIAVRHIQHKTVVLLYYSLFCYNMFSTRHCVAAMTVHRLAHTYGISQCKQVLDQQNNELASSNPTSGRHEYGAPPLDRS